MRMQTKAIGLAFSLVIILLTHSGAIGGETMDALNGTRVRLSFAGNEAVAIIHDHPASRDFLAQLPLTIAFEDYIGVEKIAYLPEKLAANGSPLQSGDFAYYAPWGNLALFYTRVADAGSGLLILGRFISGKEYLAGMTSDFTARIEIIP